MRKALVLIGIVAAVFAAACGTEKSTGRSRWNPAAPSETYPDTVRPVKQVDIRITKVSGNTYQVVVTGPDLPDTFPAIPPGTWSGAYLWLHEWTKNTNYVTDVPFEPGKTDRFTFPYVNSVGEVDFSLRLQPHGTLERIPVILNQNVTVPAGYKMVWDEKAAEMRVKGPLP